MTSSAINGIWIYRSFRNLTSPTPSFDELKVWEAEFYLEVEEGCLLHGTLRERSAIATGLEPYLHAKASVDHGQPVALRWRATGQPGSETRDWIYGYVGFPTPVTGERVGPLLEFGRPGATRFRSLED